MTPLKINFLFVFPSLQYFPIFDPFHVHVALLITSLVVYRHALAPRSQKGGNFYTTQNQGIKIASFVEYL